MKALDIIISDVNFKLTVVEHEGYKWVPVTPVCEVIGIDPYKQAQRINKDQKFNPCQLVGVASDGKQREMTFLPLLQLEAFLFTINVRSSQKPEVAARLLAFQKGICELIHNAFNNEINHNEFYKPLVETIGLLKQELADQKIINEYLLNEINSLKFSQNKMDRFVVAEKKAAASRLAHQRWANRGPQPA